MCRMFLSLACCGMLWHAVAVSSPPLATALLTVQLEPGHELGHQAQPGLDQLDAQLRRRVGGGREWEGGLRRQAAGSAGRQAGE